MTNGHEADQPAQHYRAVWSSRELEPRLFSDFLFSRADPVMFLHLLLLWGKEIDIKSVLRGIIILCELQTGFIDFSRCAGKTK